MVNETENLSHREWQYLHRSLQLPAPYKRLIDEIKQNQLRENDWTTNNLTNNRRLFNCDKRQIETPPIILHVLIANNVRA